jgi:cyclic beta-1,2-glucan synthetase
LFDAIVNHWSIYQTSVSRIAARSGFYQVSGAYGFRDQLQDALALIPVLPAEVKILILRAAAHQYEEGDVQHWWHESEKTGIRTRCSDDFLWLPYVTEEYVRQTGDSQILFLSVPYLCSAPLAEGEHERYEKTEKSECREPLFLHLIRAVKNGKRFGTHGFPLIGTCDWNDGMNLVGIHGKGESIWLSSDFIYTKKEPPLREALFLL